jgi:hypothetical protein
VQNSRFILYKNKNYVTWFKNEMQV